MELEEDVLGVAGELPAKGTEERDYLAVSRGGASTNWAIALASILIFCINLSS